MPTADELYEEAKCFLCYGMTQAQALKLALLRRQALQLDPDADVSPETLLLNASCYNCYTNGSVYDLFELALLAIIAATPCTPGNVDGLIWGPAPETVDSIAGSADALTTFMGTFFPTSTYTEFSFGNPTTVTNGIDFSTNTAITSITFRLLETVGADFDFSNCTAMVTLTLPELISVGGFINLGSCSSLTAAPFPSLTTIGGDLSLNGCTVLASISFPLLSSMNGGIDLSNCAALVSAIFPSLAGTAAYISITGSGIQTLSLPALTAYPAGGIAADASLLTLNLPACTDDAAGQLDTDLAAMTGLVTLNLASIVTITANLTLSGSPNLVSFTASAWVTTDGTTINFNGCSLNVASVELILRRCVLAGVLACTIDLSGGTNAGTASLSAQGQADVATLGAQVTMNP